MKKMINFTVGPVTASDEICLIGGEQVPYFRTEEFSNIMLENEQLIKKFVNASQDSKAVFITGSGTASMEAVIINTLTSKDRALIVNGGSFGQRFVDLCTIYSISFDEIKLEPGMALTEEHLALYNANQYTAFLVNACETSTGIHYDLNLIHEFCQKNNLFLIVDAISSFLADELDMAKMGIDAFITGSQKALACPPGISIIVLDKRAVEKVYANNVKCMYLNLVNALENAKRGQTPYTPAVLILLQIHARLKEINESGGVEKEQMKIAELATYFREKINKYPFELVAQTPSNAVTALRVLNNNADEIFNELKNNYNIFVCPNGGDLKKKIFRVGHIGNLNKSDYDKLIIAFDDLQKRGIM